MVIFYKTAIFSGLIFILGCSLKSQRAADQGEIKIVGGDVISLSEHPSTLKITFPEDDPGNLCTATFVSHNTMLTAAHCLQDKQDVFLEELGGVRSLSVHAFLPGSAINPLVDANDIGVIVFPNNTAKSFITISTASPKVGDQVTLIGYGACTKFLGPRSDFKRCKGKNKISEFTRDGRIRTSQANGVYLSKGDSGGPLLNDRGQVIGVANSAAMNSPNEHASNHAKISDPKNLSWLKSVTKSTKAIICGLDGLDCGRSNQDSDEDSNNSDRRNEPDNPPRGNGDLRARGAQLADDFIEALNSRSSNCSFELEKPIMLVENNTRFEMFILFEAPFQPLRFVRLNISLEEHSQGRDILSKMDRSGRLTTSFKGCTF